MLPDRQRDEHGMEDVDGLFSSPEKDTNGATNFSDEEQEMDIDDGTPCARQITLFFIHHTSW